jgi:hypothetical protein
MGCGASQGVIRTGDIPLAKPAFHNMNAPIKLWVDPPPPPNYDGSPASPTRYGKFPLIRHSPHDIIHYIALPARYHSPNNHLATNFQ